MTPQENKFIQHVKKECELYDVKLTITSGKSIQYADNSRCSGWFLGGKNPQLKIAGGYFGWVQILVHEFGHLHQWAENTEAWTKSEHSYGLLQDWLEGKTIKNVDKMLRDCMAVEHDCERRAVRFIREWDLPFNTVAYTQHANAYMYFWLYLKRARKWYPPELSPVHSHRVVEQMPTKFLPLDKYVLTDRIIKMYDRVTGFRA